MSIPLQCACGARFRASDDLLGRVVRCPKCKQKVRVPESVLAHPEESSAGERDLQNAEPGESLSGEVQHPADFGSTWQSHALELASPEESRVGWRRWVLLVLLLLTPVSVVATLLLVPLFRTKDPREQVAEHYLEAIRRQDWAEANRLSVLAAHPRLTHFEQLELVERQLPSPRGKFLGLAEFHARIDQQYRFNPERGRFEPKDLAGTGLGVLSQLEQAKKKVEEKIAADAAKPQRRNRSPEDQMLDDVIARYGAIAELATNPAGLLSSQHLGPTYEDLLQQTDVPLSDAERLLASHYAQNPGKWERLLGRSFLTLPGGSEFELQEVEVQAIVRVEGQSAGEPGRRVTLRMVRFIMGSIDTGWKVWQAD